MTQTEIIERIRGLAINLQGRAAESETMSSSMVQQQCSEIFDLCDEVDVPEAEAVYTLKAIK